MSGVLNYMHIPYSCFLTSSGRGKNKLESLLRGYNFDWNCFKQQLIDLKGVDVTSIITSHTKEISTNILVNHFGREEILDDLDLPKELSTWLKSCVAVDRLNETAFINHTFDQLAQLEQKTKELNLSNDPKHTYLILNNDTIVFKKRGSKKRKIYFVSIDVLRNTKPFAEGGFGQVFHVKIYKKQVQDGKLTFKVKDYVIKSYQYATDISSELAGYKVFNSTKKKSGIEDQPVQGFSLLDHSTYIVPIERSFLVKKKYDSDLHSIIHRTKVTQPKDFLMYVDYLFQGLRQLKEKGTTYLDLKSSNILVRSNEEMAISDFGGVISLYPEGKRLSYLNNSEIKESLQKVTAPFMADRRCLSLQDSLLLRELQEKAQCLLAKKDLPRKKAKKLINEYECLLNSIRVFSAGLILLELYTKTTLPDTGLGYPNIPFVWMQKEEYIENLLEQGFQKEPLELIFSMLHMNPKKRPTLDQFESKWDQIKKCL